MTLSFDTKIKRNCCGDARFWVELPSSNAKIVLASLNGSRWVWNSVLTRRLRILFAYKLQNTITNLSKLILELDLIFRQNMPHSQHCARWTWWVYPALVFNVDQRQDSPMCKRRKGDFLRSSFILTNLGHFYILKRTLTDLCQTINKTNYQEVEISPMLNR